MIQSTGRPTSDESISISTGVEGPIPPALLSSVSPPNRLRKRCCSFRATRPKRKPGNSPESRRIPNRTPVLSPFRWTLQKFVGYWSAGQWGFVWGEPTNPAYPINVLDTAKAGLPSVLGARPDEQQLLAYFHGQIGEDDLLALLEQRAQHLAKGVEAGTNEGPSADLQNYLIREFVESLYGLEETLKTALYSPRALETAFLGEFSPAALAERVLTSLRAGRRSGTAAAFPARRVGAGRFGASNNNE